MPRFLLDADICIYLAKRKPAAVFADFKALAAGNLAMSVITYGELLRTRHPWKTKPIRSSR